MCLGGRAAGRRKQDLPWRVFARMPLFCILGVGRGFSECLHICLHVDEHEYEYMCIHICMCMHMQV